MNDDRFGRAVNEDICHSLLSILDIAFFMRIFVVCLRKNKIELI